MEIKYTKKDVIDLIKLYYKQLEGREVKVSITAKKDLVGRFENVACVTTIKVKEKINLFGKEKEVVEEISDMQLLNILNALLIDKGYKINSVYFDDGLVDKTVGYGICEHTESSAYFKGIEVTVEKVMEQQVTLKKAGNIYE